MTILLTFRGFFRIVLISLGIAHASQGGEPAQTRMEHHRVHDPTVEAGIFIIQHTVHGRVILLKSPVEA